MAMTMQQQQEPLLSRIDRLDHLLRNLEEIKVGNKSSSSPRSSSPSTPSSWTTCNSDNGRGSSLEFSPRSRDKYHHCRSIEEALMEIEHKGTLLQRVGLMEDRLIKVCTQVEQEMDADKHAHEREEKSGGDHHKGLKQILKSCVKSPKSKKKDKAKLKSKS